MSRGISHGCSARFMAKTLCRSPSTTSREISKNGGRVRYRAAIADKSASRRGQRPKPFLLNLNVMLKDLADAKLCEDWSPEQIAGWLKLTYPDDESMRVSHETICKSLFVQTRGLLRKELHNHLGSKRKFRHAKGHKPGPGQQIVDGVSIQERPADVDDRAVPGHWEGDLSAVQRTAILPLLLNGRPVLHCWLKSTERRQTEVVPALAGQLAELPERFKHSLTWDRGTDLASHQKFTVATDIDVYFCDPSSP